jgi:hypothetical protein
LTQERKAFTFWGGSFVIRLSWFQCFSVLRHHRPGWRHRLSGYWVLSVFAFYSWFIGCWLVRSSVGLGSVVWFRFLQLVHWMLVVSVFCRIRIGCLVFVGCLVVFSSGY